MPIKSLGGNRSNHVMPHIEKGHGAIITVKVSVVHGSCQCKFGICDIFEHSRCNPFQELTNVTQSHDLFCYSMFVTMRTVNFFMDFLTNSFRFGGIYALE